MNFKKLEWTSITTKIFGDSSLLFYKSWKRPLPIFYITINKYNVKMLPQCVLSFLVIIYLFLCTNKLHNFEVFKNKSNLYKEHLYLHLFLMVWLIHKTLYIIFSVKVFSCSYQNSLQFNLKFKMCKSKSVLRSFQQIRYSFNYVCNIFHKLQN